MKIKELDKTVNLAWSPSQQHPILLAAGTAAQQLDASFSTSAALELYSLNLSDPGLDLELHASVPSQYRFHNIAWGGWHSSREADNGIIVGGCEGGRLQMYSVSRLLAGEEGLIISQDRHSGPVRSIDFNAFQGNLLATGASESEIFIWDLNNTNTPMTPGAKSQPAEDVVWLSWNRQVQHILASTFGTRCIIWDLRKNEPIIKLTDTNSRVRWKVVAWHPDIATQLCLASEDDANAVIQLWDLRFATTPIKTFEGHQRGVLSIAWCAQDPDLLISCGKDNRIVCWNPNSAEQGQEIVYELVSSNQYNFEVSWCPRNPNLVATSSFDGHASVYSLMGGEHQVQTTNKIADSFPGVDQYAQAPVVQPPHSQVATVELRKAPKWLRKPAGASFAFGGKLVSFNSDSRTVNISQVVTEASLVQRSQSLQQALATGQFDTLRTGATDLIWEFVFASLQPDYRERMKTLLGFSPEQLELDRLTGESDIDEVVDGLAGLNHNGPKNEDEDDSPCTESPFDSFNAEQSKPFGIIGNKQITKESLSPFKIPVGNDADGNISRALLCGNIELAVKLCIKEDRMSDAIILAASADPQLLEKTRKKYFEQNKNLVSHLIKAVVTQEWDQVINNCDPSSWAEALVTILTYAKDDEIAVFCERLGQRLDSETENSEAKKNAEICYVAAGKINKVVQKRTSENEMSTEKLQDLVELVLIAQGGNIGNEEETGRLLTRYAQILASQGDLMTALQYLGDSYQEDIAELRERLYIAVGHKPVSSGIQQPSRQQNNYYQNNSSLNYGSSYSKPTQQMFGSQAPLPPANKPPPQPFVNQSNQAHPNSQGFPPPLSNQPFSQPFQPFSQQSNQPFAPPPTNQAFVPPSSNQTFAPPGSNVSFSPLSSNQPFPPPTSNLVAPPVSSSQSFPPVSTNNQFNTQITNQLPPSGLIQPTSTKMFTPNIPQSQPQPNSVQFNAGVQNIPKPPPTNAVPPTSLHRSSPSPSPSLGRSKYIVDPSVAGTPSYNRTAQVAPFNPIVGQENAYNNYAAQSAQYNSQPGQQQFTPVPTQLFSSQQIFNPPTGAAPVVNQPSYPTETKPQVFSPQTPAAPGWNDPPFLSGNTRSQKKEAVLPQEPITHPLFGASNPVSSYGQYPEQGQQHQQQQQQQQQLYNPVSQMKPFDQYSSYGNYGNVEQIPQNSRLTSASPAPATIAKPAEPPQPKPPLPEEHMYLQTVFEELRNRCTCAANNPQLRKKLEDVARKLEVLYDSLRSGKLSQGSLSGLHEMVQAVQNGDYTKALHLHTQMVSGPDFSQISSFMPGLKVLIQSALQLGVYLQ